MGLNKMPPIQVIATVIWALRGTLGATTAGLATGLFGACFLAAVICHYSRPGINNCKVGFLVYSEAYKYRRILA